MIPWCNEPSIPILSPEFPKTERALLMAHTKASSLAKPAGFGLPHSLSGPGDRSGRIIPNVITPSSGVSPMWSGALGSGHCCAAVSSETTYKQSVNAKQVQHVKTGNI